MRYLRLMFLFGQLARLALLDTNPGGAGGSGSGSTDSGGAGGAGSGGTGSGSAGTGGTGGGGAGTGGAGGAADSAAGSPAGAGAGDTAGTGQSGAQGGAQDVASLPAWAQTVIRTAREEAARNRVGRTAAEQARTDALKALAASLGVDVTAGTPDPAQLQGQVQTLTGERDGLQGQVRSLTVRLAAWPAAAQHGADAGALMDSATFLASVDKLDPAADDFATKLGDAVKAALTANPKLRAGQAPARGGFDPAGGTGRTTTATSLEDAITRKYAAATT